MVDDEHDAGIVIDRSQRLFVGGPEPHAVQQPNEPPGQVVADAEVRIGIERRHDFPGVPGRLRHQHVPRGSRCGRLPVDGFQHFGVVGQAIDEDLALGSREAGNLELQALIEVFDHAIEAAAYKPANAWHQHAVNDRPDREYCPRDDQPKRERHGVIGNHSAPGIRRACSNASASPAGSSGQHAITNWRRPDPVHPASRGGTARTSSRLPHSRCVLGSPTRPQAGRRECLVRMRSASGTVRLPLRWMAGPSPVQSSDHGRHARCLR